MKALSFYLLLLFFVSCKSYTSSQIGSGRFQRSHKETSTELILNSDSTFTLIENWFGINSSCSGTWRYISPDTISIACSPPELMEMMVRGYMSDRERKIVVVDSNKLYLLHKTLHPKRTVILKRKNR